MAPCSRRTIIHSGDRDGCDANSDSALADRSAPLPDSRLGTGGAAIGAAPETENSVTRFIPPETQISAARHRPPSPLHFPLPLFLSGPPSSFMIPRFVICQHCLSLRFTWGELLLSVSLSSVSFVRVRLQRGLYRLPF